MQLTKHLNMKQFFSPRFIAKLGLFIGITGVLLSCGQIEERKETDAETIKVQGEMMHPVVPPPLVPRPVGDRAATNLKIEMEIVEKIMEISDGVTYNFWTFDGTVPGSFLRARVGDEIEFVLKNHPDNKVPHNIDLHAVTGPGGGAEATFVAPGKQASFKFKALNPGLYVYHCATAPVGMHIANGMYGLILVEPEGGLPPVDKEYYVMQGDFYTEGETNERGFQAFDNNKAIEEDAEYVVFNGRVGSLTNDGALRAEVGETVRLFVGNGGPNLVSSFHVIGEIFDKVYVEGGMGINEHVGATLIPAGGATIVDFKVEVPGDLVLVDHSIFRAFNKGALGILAVEGSENKQVFSDQLTLTDYNPGTPLSDEGMIVPSGDTIPIVEMSLDDKLAHGETIYQQSCVACHQATGAGIPNVFPPLAGADYLNEDLQRAIEIVKHGMSGEIIVNGEIYNSVMPPQNLSDQEIASVLTYIYNNWGNDPQNVTTDMVKTALE